MKVIGRWTKKKGSIIVTIPEYRVEKGRNRPYPLKVKYIGDPDEPFSPAAVERDLRDKQDGYGIKTARVIPTSPRGGTIVVSDNEEM
jgi:hypothetical protein